MARAIVGSSHHQPSAAFARMLASTPAAAIAHSFDWAASPAVAADRSFAATRRFARLRQGMTMTAPVAAAETFAKPPGFTAELAPLR